MDIDDIQNEFACLGESHFRRYKIAHPKYQNGISLFGVGVFSYFMVADSFEVRTRKRNGKFYKFQISKDFFNDFYFFNENETDFTGTSIKFNLSKHFCQEFSKIEDFLNFLTKYFRLVKIPIYFDLESNRRRISQRNFFFYPLKTKCMTENNSKVAEQLIKMENMVSLKPFTAPNYKGTIFYSKKNTRNTLSYPKIQYFFKNIFIKEVTLENLLLPFYCIGKINIYDVKVLTLNRNNMWDAKFETKIQSKVLEEIFKSVPVNRYVSSKNFCSQFVNRSDFKPSLVKVYELNTNDTIYLELLFSRIIFDLKREPMSLLHLLKERKANFFFEDDQHVHSNSYSDEESFTPQIILKKKQISKYILVLILLTSRFQMTRDVKGSIVLKILHFPSRDTKMMINSEEKYILATKFDESDILFHFGNGILFLNTHYGDRRMKKNITTIATNKGAVAYLLNNFDTLEREYFSKSRYQLFKSVAEKIKSFFLVKGQ
ncbi:Chaperone protein HtpG [Candidatus Lokiarchaeum ossiferum]|uniref:Chaperone protein HtpG n=1 Tax=Candidatus Lokiarchaeum ossiferum TaxID=2951803 RepID=A0ABY6HYL9_9ARCH|nr:Chaperone protein HtpG [Candidatus Lokiarchaeum sp. B-35]